jgi:hypothetical protein
MQALRTYGRETAYRVKTGTEIGLGTSVAASRHASSEWQYDEIAKLFSPICYRKGKCTMMASFDRKCSIRERVEANASVNRPSTEWHLPLYAVKGDRGEALLVADEISPSEWMLDPGAAR